MNKSESIRIVETVGKYLDTYFPSKDNRPMILGVSGGPDSMALLYIFSKLDVELTVVHCNYQLRDDDSDKDQKLVEETASMWGFDAFSARLEPEEAASQNFQSWARDRRYQIFRDLKRESNALAIVTAHHQDDQLETIIQKILRGSGMTAWKGMDVWNGELFRPLLDVSKAELLQFVSGNNVPYRLDSSNEESTYARNFLRNGWFPVMDDLFPGWRDNIMKVPERAREHEALTMSLVQSLAPDHRNIDRQRFLALAPEVQKPLLLQIMKYADPEIKVSSGALKNLDNLGSLQTGKKLTVNEAWSLVRNRDRFTFVEEAEGRGDSDAITLSKETLDNQKEKKVEPGLLLSISVWDGEILPTQLQLDTDSLEWPLKIRTWRDGDQINPFGMDGTQNISDHLTNEKISAERKSDVRIAEAFDGKICAVIFPPDHEGEKTGTIANWARCTPDTSEILKIRHTYRQ